MFGNTYKALLFSILAIVVAGILFLSRVKVSQDSLEISIPNQPAFALVYIAQNKGFFDEEHLAVAIKDFNSGRDALADVINGSSDLAAVAETPLAKDILDGNKIKILGSIYSSIDNTQLVVFKNKVLGPDKLAGKKIALMRGTSMEFYLASLLKSQGMPLDSVKMVNYNAADYEDLIKKGDVDGFVIWDPYKVEALRKYSKELIELKSDIYSEHGFIVGKSDVIDSKSEAVTRFLKGLKKSEDYLKDHPREAIAIVSDAIGERNDTDVSNSWDDFNINLEMSNLSNRSLGYVLDWMWQSGRYQTIKPDIKEYLDPKYLRLVKPESVTVY